MNLETFFTMKYDIYELLFCVEKSDDPAISMVTELMEKYPKIDAKLVVGGSNVGINPKINNMHPGYERSKYDLIMISDDKMLIQPYALQEMVNKISSDDKIGIVTQNCSYYSKRTGFSATFDHLIFLFSSLFSLTSTIGLTKNLNAGMSTLYEKEIFEKVGGLQIFGKFMDEDTQFSHCALKYGWKIKFSHFPGLQNSKTSGIFLQWKRYSRWYKTITKKSFNMFLVYFIIL